MNNLSMIFFILFVSSAPATANEIYRFDEWSTRSPKKAAVLNIFPGFKEPTVLINDDGVKKNKELKMVVYSLQAKAVADIGVANIKLSGLISPEAFRNIDPMARHVKISTAQTMPEVVGNKPIRNFTWCNRDRKNPDIFLPQLELVQAHMARPPGRAWCTPDSRTACYETCRLLTHPSALEGLVAAYNSLAKAKGKHGKDFGMAIQSEVRIHQDGREFDTNLASLTGVASPVEGVLEISIFYVNQILNFGKILIVFQKLPSDAQKTQVTALTAFGVRSEAWNHSIYGGRLQALLKSDSTFNEKTGILAGAPEFTRILVDGLARYVEK